MGRHGYQAIQVVGALGRQVDADASQWDNKLE
jgi:hypothetical protein